MVKLMVLSVNNGDDNK